MKTIIDANDGPRTFHGTLIAEAGRAGPGERRWVTLKLYRKNGGGFALELALRSIADGEPPWEFAVVESVNVLDLFRGGDSEGAPAVGEHLSDEQAIRGVVLSYAAAEAELFSKAKIVFPGEAGYGEVQ